MKIRYYSINGGGIVNATVPKEVEKELKAKWFLHKRNLKKQALKILSTMQKLSTV